MVQTFQFYYDLCRPPQLEVFPGVIQTLGLMTLVCAMFGLLSDSLIGRLEGDLLGCFQRVTNSPSADSHNAYLRAQRFYSLL